MSNQIAPAVQPSTYVESVFVPHLSVPISGHILLVDEVSWNKVKHISWSLLSRSNASSSYYLKNSTLKTSMHRLIMGLSTGDPRQVDHINGNGLDNRRCNLRIVSKLQNRQNIHKHSTTHNSAPKASEFKGVYIDYRRKTLKYVCRISINGKPRYIGTFNSEIEAAKAYNDAAKNIYGDYACLNVFSGGAI